MSATRKRCNTRLYSYVQLLLSDRRMSQKTLADLCGCSLSAVNQVLTGRKHYAIVESCIARNLGYGNFQQLQESADVFHDWFASRFLGTRPGRAEGGSK